MRLSKLFEKGTHRACRYLLERKNAGQKEIAKLYDGSPRDGSVEPYLYLRLLFERLPFAQTLDDCEAPLPQNLSPDPMPVATDVV